MSVEDDTVEMISPIARRTKVRSLIRRLDSSDAYDGDENNKEPAPDDQRNTSRTAHILAEEEQHKDVHRECDRPKRGRDIASILERALDAAEDPAYYSAVLEPLEVHHRCNGLQIVRDEKGDENGDDMRVAVTGWSQRDNLEQHRASNTCNTTSERKSLTTQSTNTAMPDRAPAATKLWSRIG